MLFRRRDRINSMHWLGGRSGTNHLVMLISLLLLFVSQVSFGDIEVPPQFDKFIGVHGLNPPEFVPVDIAVDSAGNVYVLDFYHKRVRRYDQNRNVTLEIPVDREHDFISARALTVDNAGNIYVSDSARSNISTDPTGAKIVKFDKDGNRLKSWPATAWGIGSDGSSRLVVASKVTNTVEIFDLEGNFVMSMGGPGTLRLPADATITTDGHVYVATHFSQIKKFDPDGNVIQIIGADGAVSLDFPASVALDADENLFVTDRHNNRVMKFDHNGVLLKTVGDKGHGPSLFIQPLGLDVDPSGNVWVANYHGHNIQQFDNNLGYISSITGTDTGFGAAARLSGLSVDSYGGVYISDEFNNRITKFDSAGNFILAWGQRGNENGEFNFPRALAVDTNDNVYVADCDHVSMFDRFGIFIKRWGGPRIKPSGCSFSRCAKGMAVASNGDIFFTSESEHGVVKIDRETGDEAFIGGKGSDDGKFNRPWGVAIGPNNRLYIADSENARVQVLALDGTYIHKWGIRGTGQGEFRRPKGLAVDKRGDVYVGDDISGRIQKFDAEGNYSTEWTIDEPTLSWKIIALATDDVGGTYVANKMGVQRFGTPANVQKQPDLLKRPNYQLGADEGVFLWKETFDGPYHLRVNGQGTLSVFDVQLMANKRLSTVTPYSLERYDVLDIKENGYALTARVSSQEDGIDFTLPPRSKALIAVERNGERNPGHLHVGELGAPLDPVGWIVDQDALPSPQEFQPGSDIGLFIGHDGMNIISRISGGEDWHTTQLSLFSPFQLSNILPVGLEGHDVLQQTDYYVELNGGVGPWWDGLDVVWQSGATIGFNYRQDDVFLPYYVNPTVKDFGVPNDLGLPNAYVLPMLEPYGEPDYSAMVNKGLFLWKDDVGVWHLRATAGGGFARYRGVITADLPASNVAGVQLESQDVLNVIDGRQIEFDLQMVDGWQDGIDFQFPEGAHVEVQLDENTEDAAKLVHIGQGKWPISQLPLDISGW